MSKQEPTRRVDVRQGYDLWANSYDATDNPVVAADSLHTPPLLRVVPGHRVLDAACGTGRITAHLVEGGAKVVGLDLSANMLAQARRRFPRVPLVHASLEEPLPFSDGTFDTIVCALVGEHLVDLVSVFRELRRVSRSAARLVFSVYHPAMAEAGREANFVLEGVQVRLGAQRHSRRDYETACERGGFRKMSVHEYRGSDTLVKRMPSARKFLGFPLLLVLVAHAEPGLPR